MLVFMNNLLTDYLRLGYANSVWQALSLDLNYPVQVLQFNPNLVLVQNRVFKDLNCVMEYPCIRNDQSVSYGHGNGLKRLLAT